ncbi:MAG: FAD-binding protein [Bacteroidota bacterium]
MPERKATVKFDTDVIFENKHFTEHMNCRRAYKVRTPTPRNPDRNVEDMGVVAVALEGIINDAINAGATLRPAGGAWSLSDVAFSGDWLLDTLSMNLKWRMKKEQVRDDYPRDFDKLYLFQCGNSIQEVNERLESDGNSLSTCGASNGQTIAGAISTGTHGSAFQYGSMTEYVAGIHLVAGPGNTIWLERASHPVVTDKFVAAIGARLVREDDMFNAALVSFGSFGIIAGFLIEAEEKYELECVRRRMDLTPEFRKVMNDLKTHQVNLPRPGEIPWHFEVTFNPHDIAGGGYVRTMYKRKFDEARPENPPTPSGSIGPGEGLMPVIGGITTLGSSAVVAKVVGLLVKKSLATDSVPFTGACSEVFTTTTLRGRAMSMELGIAAENSTAVLDLLMNLQPEVNLYAGVISYRWVKQCRALLGWTKFPVTATIEFNASHNNRTMAFYRRVWKELELRGIHYTLHWGQMSEFNPALLRKMYGNSIDQWKECRNRLMSEQSKAVFTNNFMLRAGLA